MIPRIKRFGQYFSGITNYIRAHGLLHTLYIAQSTLRNKGIFSFFTRLRILSKKYTDRSFTENPSLKISKGPNGIFPFRVLLIAELSLPQCRKYRVDQKVEFLKKCGYDCTVLDWKDSSRCRSALQLFNLVILYRVPAYPAVLKMIAEAKRLNVPILYDIDDLIFDIQEYRKNKNLDSLPRSTKRSVLSGVPLYRRAIELCDGWIASTRALGNHLRSASGKEGFILSNALDAQTLRLARVIVKRSYKKDSSRVQIFYGSGSKAHTADFSIAADGLAEIAEKYPQVIISIVGDVKIPKVLRKAGAAIVTHPSVSYQDYLALLAAADINIVPLEKNDFNDSKSNIKYLEASVFGIPSICSPAEEFVSIIESGKNGFIAGDKREWVDALSYLIESPRERTEMGNRARKTVATRYSPKATIENELTPLVERFVTPAEPGLRLLTANIYFNPQKFGGATIVAEETALILNSRPDFTVMAFSGNENIYLEPYELHRYEVRGIPTVSMRVPKRPDPVLEYRNDDAIEPFSRVLEAFQPDIVHFHSIQHLSASLAAACKKMGIPYVITLHDAWWLCERQFMVNRYGKYCFQTEIDFGICRKCVDDIEFTKKRFFWLRRILQGASLLLTPSEFHRSIYIANGIDPLQIAVNRNGITPPKKERAPSPTPGIIRFGFVGGMGPIKGADLIKKAFRELTHENYIFFVVDATMHLGLSSISQTDWDIPGHVEILPAYTQDTIDEFFEKIDILLFPSQWKESFGLTVREALVRDVWVIVTDSGGAVEDIVDGQNGTIIPIGDHVALREAIRVFLENPNILKNYVNRYKSKITTFEDQAVELRGQLIDVLKKRGGPSVA